MMAKEKDITETHDFEPRKGVVATWVDPEDDSHTETGPPCVVCGALEVHHAGGK